MMRLDVRFFAPAMALVLMSGGVVRAQMPQPIPVGQEISFEQAVDVALAFSQGWPTGADAFCDGIVQLVEGSCQIDHSMDGMFAIVEDPEAEVIAAGVTEGEAGPLRVNVLCSRVGSVTLDQARQNADPSAEVDAPGLPLNLAMETARDLLAAGLPDRAEAGQICVHRLKVSALQWPDRAENADLAVLARHFATIEPVESVEIPGARHFAERVNHIGRDWTGPKGRVLPLQIEARVTVDWNRAELMVMSWVVPAGI